MIYHSASDWQEVEAAPGVRRRVLSCGDQVMVVQFRIAEGAEVPSHTHPHEQVGHVVSGRLRFRIGDDERELREGDSWYVPSNVPHTVTTLEDSIAIDIFSPPRDEYR